MTGPVVRAEAAGGVLSMVRASMAVQTGNKVSVLVHHVQ
jgi:hypothetical protein